MPTWKMAAPCADCPFSASKAGKHLRRTLGRARVREIETALRSDQHFVCHKTSDETGNGTNLICAGALAWQEERGLSSNLQRVMERLEWFAQQRKAKAPAYRFGR